MARKAPKKPGKVRGFGLGADAATVDEQGAPVMGTVSRMFPDQPEPTITEKLFRAPVVPAEPLLRVANVGTIGAGAAAEFLGVKGALTTVLAANFIDVLMRQVSANYRSAFQFGAWNRGVLWIPR